MAADSIPHPAGFSYPGHGCRARDAADDTGGPDTRRTQCRRHPPLGTVYGNSRPELNQGQYMVFLARDISLNIMKYIIYFKSARDKKTIYCPRFFTGLVIQRRQVGDA